MLFELINTSVTFQNIMNDMLKLYLNKFVIIYLDNILIFSKNEEKHVEYVRLVIKAFRTNDFYVKLSKYVFFQKYIEFCDHIINDEKIKINKTKLKTIKN